MNYEDQLDNAYVKLDDLQIEADNLTAELEGVMMYEIDESYQNELREQLYSTLDAIDALQGTINCMEADMLMLKNMY